MPWRLPTALTSCPTGESRCKARRSSSRSHPRSWKPFSARNTIASCKPKESDMAQRVVDCSLLIEDNMPAHKLFQRTVITTHMSHDYPKTFNLQVPGDAMTYQTNVIAT